MNHLTRRGLFVAGIAVVTGAAIPKTADAKPIGGASEVTIIMATGDTVLHRGPLKGEAIRLPVEGTFSVWDRKKGAWRPYGGRVGDSYLQVHANERSGR